MFFGIERVNVPPRGGDIELLLQPFLPFRHYHVMNNEALFNVML